MFTRPQCHLDKQELDNKQGQACARLPVQGQLTTSSTYPTRTPELHKVPTQQQVRSPSTGLAPAALPQQSLRHRAAACA